MNFVEFICFVFMALLFCIGKLEAIEPHRDHFSQHEHYSSDHGHNAAFDHDAFLGPDAEKFDKLSPEEAKRRLKIIVVSKIDVNKDEVVSLEELERWINIQRKAFMYEAVNENIAQQDKDKDGKISWEEYKVANFGEWDNSKLPEDHNLRRQIRKKQHKFEVADEDKDGKMDRHEYVNFEHPEETKHMEELAIDEIIDDVDKNGDRFISLEEFLGQYDEEAMPGWVERERVDFAKQFDKDKDGKLNREEVRNWVLPEKSDTLDEAKHLIDGSDENADGSLSLDEIILHYDLFVGSRATDHGQTLKKMNHDEF